MNNAGTSTNSAVAGHRDPLHPIGVTHIDIGCVACGNIIKGPHHVTPLRKLISEHKRSNPDCFDGSAIANIADCARAAEERQRSNMALFERNRFGDTDGFFDTTGDVAVVQCTSCCRCFQKKAEGDGHVRAGRNKCSGASDQSPTTSYFGLFNLF